MQERDAELARQYAEYEARVPWLRAARRQWDEEYAQRGGDELSQAERDGVWGMLVRLVENDHTITSLDEARKRLAENLRRYARGGDAARGRRYAENLLRYAHGASGNSRKGTQAW